MSASVFDAAIVGGGLAGCSAAIALAKRGARVVLLEARTYPHHKVCGEFLSPEFLPLLDALGAIPAVRALGPVEIETFSFTAPGGARWEARFPGGVGWGVSRAALDAALAGRARETGADVREGTTVTGIEGDLREGFTLRLRSAEGAGQVRARTVIAAHGKRSALDRALSRRFLQRPQPFVGLKAHFHGPPLPRRVDLYTFPGGYCGMSEVEGGVANVCLLVRESEFRVRGGGPPADVNAFIAWMGSQNPRLGEWLCQSERIHERWLSISQVPFVGKSPVEGDILMAGDAAGLIAPLAGDGMTMALRAGQMAAERIAAFLDGRESGEAMTRRYAADWRRTFAERLRLGRALQALLLRPILCAPALRLAAAIPPLGDFLVNHTRDKPLLKPRVIES